MENLHTPLKKQRKGILWFISCPMLWICIGFITKILYLDFKSGVSHTSPPGVTSCIFWMRPNCNTPDSNDWITSCPQVLQNPANDLIIWFRCADAETYIKVRWLWPLRIQIWHLYFKLLLWLKFWLRSAYPQRNI